MVAEGAGRVVARDGTAQPGFQALRQRPKVAIAEVAEGLQAQERRTLLRLRHYNVVDGRDLGRAGIDADRLENGAERRAEPLESLHRFPDVEHPKLIARAVTGMVETARGSPAAGRLQPADAVIVLGTVHRSGFECDCKSHGFTSQS